MGNRELSCNQQKHLGVGEHLVHRETTAEVLKTEVIIRGSENSGLELISLNMSACVTDDGNRLILCDTAGTQDLEEGPLIAPRSNWRL